MKNTICKNCGGSGHSAFHCFKNKRSPLRKNRKFMRTLGKQGRKWLQVRAEWFTLNPAEFYYCYIDGEQLTRSEVELDHIKSRSRHPELRYEFSNLAPICHTHNQSKGSLSLKQFKDKLEN